MPLNDAESALFEEYRPKNEFKRAHTIAVEKDPDTYAKDLEAARARTLPVDVVERNRDKVVKLNKIDEIDYDDMERNNPGTTKYLADPENAIISSDDHENLRQIESSFRKPKKGYFENALANTIDSGTKLLFDLVELTGNLGEDFVDYMERLNIPNPGIRIGEDGISFHQDLSGDDLPSALTAVRESAAMLSESKPAGYEPDFTWDRLKDEPTPTNLAGFAFEQFAGSVPHMLASVYTLPAYIASRTEAFAEERAKNNDEEEVDTEDLITSLIPATVSAMMERYITKLPFQQTGIKTLGGVGASVAGVALKEGSTEAIQEAVEYLGVTAGTKKGVDLLEMGDQMLAGAVAGGVIGGTLRTGTAAVEYGAHRRAAAKRAVGNTVTESQVVDEQNTIDNIVQYFQESKTAERSDEHFDKFLDEVAPNRSFYVPKDAVAKMKNLPESITERISENDPDVILPVNQLKIIASDEELLAELRPHMRLSPELPTQAEIETADQDVQNLVSQAVARRQSEQEAQDIYNQVRDQLIDTRRLNREDAKTSAQLYPAYAVAKAEALGITPAQVFENFNLQIIGPDQKPKMPDTPTDTESTLLNQQDFTDIEFVDKVIVKESGKKATIRKKAQRAWDTTQKRVEGIDRVIKCLG